MLLGRGGVAPARLPQAALALGSALGRWPFTTAERAYMAWKRPRLAPLQPPVFIVGHWRSGTTHLYNMMSKADFGFVPPLAAGMPWDLLGLVALLRPLLERALPPDRFIDKIPVLPDSPQEDELALANMCPVSFYHGIYFPKRFAEHFAHGIFLEGCSATEVAAWRDAFRLLLDKLAIQQDGRRIVVKNPVYTARIALLCEMIPGAKFIHVHRNPYEVFVSMRNFYKKLFRELALQDWDHLDVDEIILDTYPRMMERFAAESAELPAGSFVELGYRELVEDPLGALETVYGTLELDGFAAARPRVEAYLETVRGYQKNRFEMSDEAARLIEARWRPWLGRWGYQRPGTEPPATGRAVG